MNNYESIEITVRDGQFRKIETHKWPIIQWDKLEKTWSYLRKKYGTFKTKLFKTEPTEDTQDSWVSD